MAIPNPRQISRADTGPSELQSRTSGHAHADGILERAKDFETFLTDVRDTCMLQSHHQAYHTLRAVLHVFRSHLSVGDALQFAGILPPVTRAIFVENWTPGSDPAPFPDRETLRAEVKAVRPDHNVAPASAIADVAAALRRTIDTGELDRVLRTLPSGAAAFWGVHA